jgi:hypothetical protein
MNKVIKKGLTITKVLICNKIKNESGYDGSACQLTFNDGSKITYECPDIDELENEHKGIYELLENGTYTQIEDWE